jgi:hypothetical protein
MANFQQIPQSLKLAAGLFGLAGLLHLTAALIVAFYSPQPAILLSLVIGILEICIGAGLLSYKRLWWMVALVYLAIQIAINLIAFVSIILASLTGPLSITLTLVTGFAFYNLLAQLLGRPEVRAVFLPNTTHAAKAAH